MKKNQIKSFALAALICASSAALPLSTVCAEDTANYLPAYELTAPIASGTIAGAQHWAIDLNTFYYYGHNNGMNFPDTPIWYSFRHYIRKAVIEDTIMSIGSSFFYGCSDLTDIKLPKGVSFFGQYAFANTGFTQFEVPASVTFIGVNAFKGCENLKDIYFYNPQCKIYGDENTISNQNETVENEEDHSYINGWILDNPTKDIGKFSGTIHGYKDSTAQKYAEKYGYKFKLIEGEPPVPEETAEKVLGLHYISDEISTNEEEHNNLSIVKLPNKLRYSRNEKLDMTGSVFDVDILNYTDFIDVDEVYKVVDIHFSDTVTSDDPNFSVYYHPDKNTYVSLDDFTFTDDGIYTFSAHYSCCGLNDRLTAMSDFNVIVGDGELVQPTTTTTTTNTTTTTTKKTTTTTTSATTKKPTTAPTTQSTSATTTESTTQSTSAATTESTTQSTSAKTTESTTQSTSATTTASATSTYPDADKVTLYGDANCDGKINIADTVMILQFLCNPDVYGLNGSNKSHITLQGVYNGDVYENGSGLTPSDGLSIQKYLLSLITSLPEC